MEEETISVESKRITTELLQKAIRNKEGSDDIVVKSFEVKEQFLSNLVSCLFCVRVYVGNNGCENVHNLFIKIIRDDKIIKHLVLVLSKFYIKEEMSYKQIIQDMMKFQKDLGLEQLGPSVPAYYFSEADSSKGIMILEDLKPHGYVRGSRQDGLDYEQCELALGELARFHALSFAMKAGSVDNVRKYENLFHEGGVTSPLSPYLTNGFKTSIELLKNFAIDEYLKNAVDRLTRLDLQKTLGDLIKPREPYALICHGDFGSTNVVFNYSDISPKNPLSAKLVDFQLVRYALPTTDLSYFFFLGVTRKLRKQHMKSLLRHYHATFIESLATVKVDFPEYTFEVLEKMFEETALFGIIFALMLTPVIFPDHERSGHLDLQGPSASELENSFSNLFKILLKEENNVVQIKDRVLGVMEDAIEMGVI